MVDRIGVRLQLVQRIIALWRFPRGRTRVGTWLSSRIRQWPTQCDVRFPYGVLAGVNLSDPIEHYRNIFLYGVMDPENTAALNALLRPADTVIDGGANSGYYSLVASALIGPAGRCLAFEPAPAIARRLEKSLRLSRASNVVLHEKALGERPGQERLFLFPQDPNGLLSSFAAELPGRAAGTAVTCEVVSLDELMPDPLPRVSWVKLDVEGAELAALRGAERLLSSPEPPVVAFEYNASTAEGMSYHPDAILELLRDRGYRFYLPRLDRRRLRLTPIQPEYLRGGDSPMVWCIPNGPYHDRLQAWIDRE